MHAPFISDDISKIVDNPDVKSINSGFDKFVFSYATSPKNFRHNDPSRPIVYFSFAVNYVLDGINPFGYRLFNLIIHILNGILCFFIVKEIMFILRLPWMIVSIASSLIFAVHPANVNVVAYVYSRSDALATLFYLASILSFARSDNNKLLSKASIFLFFLALFSKQIAVTLPVIILLYDLCFTSKFDLKDLIKQRRKHYPYWLTLILYICFRYLYLGGIGDLEARETINRYFYLATQPSVILKYLTMTLIPHGFSFDHNISPLTSIWNLKSLVPLTIILSIWGYLLTKTFRRSEYIWVILTFGFSWFLVTLLPTSSIFPTTNVFVENRMYLAGIGISLIAAYVINSLKSYSFPMLALVVLTLSALTWNRNQIYKDPILIEEEILSKYPDHPRSNNNLALLLRDDVRAEHLLKKAIAAKPDYADAHSNLALLYYKRKEHEKSILEYNLAVSLNPRLYNAWFNLGNIYANMKDFSRSEEHYLKAIQENSQYYQAYVNLGLLYSSTQQTDKAKTCFLKAIEIKPDYVESYINLGILLASLKKFEEAEGYLVKAVLIDPKNAYAHINLGNLYQIENKKSQAKSEFQIALLLLPGNTFLNDRIKKLGGI